MRAPSFPPPPGQPTTVSISGDIVELARWITDPGRERPLVVLTTRNDQRDPYFPPGGVQRLVSETGDVVVIRQSPKGRLTRELAHALPEGLMVFNGAARIYWPFALTGQDPDRHPLIRADSDKSPGAEKRARLTNRWRQGPGDTSPHTPNVAAAAIATDVEGVGEGVLRIAVTRAWLTLLPDPDDRARFVLPAFHVDAELVDQLQVLEPARAPVAAAAAQVLSGHAWTQTAPVPERVQDHGSPVLRDGDHAVAWSFPLEGSDHRLFYWQPATGAPVTLTRIGVAADDPPPTPTEPAAAPAPTVPPRRAPSPTFEIPDEDLLRVLQAADEPVYVSEIRAALAIPEDISRERVAKVLNDAIERGLVMKTGQRRGTRYATA